MELTINIKGQKNIATFLAWIRKFDYVEIVDVRKGSSALPGEHKLPDERLRRIERMKASFGTINSSANIPDEALLRENINESDGR